MRIDRRLVLIGVMLVVLSMTMATQYATTKVSYSFAIVHPANADVRFIGSDNSSDDGTRMLRITDNSSGSQFLTIELGDHAPSTWKNYTAAFGIVNEENFTVSITHMNLSGTNTSYFTVWVHRDRDVDYGGDAADSCVKVISDGTALFGVNDTVWSLAAGDGDTTDMSDDGSASLATPWDETADLKYSINDANNSINGTSDFVWVGISLNVPSDAGPVGAVTGTLFINFKSTTDT